MKFSKFLINICSLLPSSLLIRINQLTDPCPRNMRQRKPHIFQPLFLPRKIILSIIPHPPLPQILLLFLHPTPFIPILFNLQPISLLTLPINTPIIHIFPTTRMFSPSKILLKRSYQLQFMMNCSIIIRLSITPNCLRTYRHRVPIQ